MLFISDCFQAVVFHFEFNCDRSLCGFLWAYLVWGSLIFMGLRFLCLMPNEGSFQALFFKPSFSPHSCSSQTLMVQMLSPFYYPIIPEALFIYFLPVFLSVIYMGELYCSVFKFTDSSLREERSPTACGKDSQGSAEDGGCRPWDPCWV